MPDGSQAPIPEPSPEEEAAGGRAGPEVVVGIGQEAGRAAGAGSLRRSMQAGRKLVPGMEGKT